MGIFLFFPGAALLFFKLGTFLLLLCIPGELMSPPLLLLFDLTIKMACCYFCGGLLIYLHLYIRYTLCLKKHTNNLPLSHLSHKHEATASSQLA